MPLETAAAFSQCVVLRTARQPDKRTPETVDREVEHSIFANVGGALMGRRMDFRSCPSIGPALA